MGLATRKDENLVLARQIFGWFVERDMASLMSVLHDEVEARPSIDGAPVLRGRDAVAQWWKRFTSLGGDIEVRPLDFEARGDCVIVRGYLRERRGRELSESQVYWLCEIRDGLIRRMESHPTRNTALASL